MLKQLIKPAVIAIGVILISWLVLFLDTRGPGSWAEGAALGFLAGFPVLVVFGGVLTFVITKKKWVSLGVYLLLVLIFTSIFLYISELSQDNALGCYRVVKDFSCFQTHILQTLFFYQDPRIAK